MEALLADAPEVAFRLLLRPWVGATPYREYRLWRNDPRIRFEGAIHEKVVPPSTPWRRPTNRPVGACDLLLNHIGYEGDQTRKHHRNLPLLRRQVKAEPDNLFNWHHLARVLAGLGRERQSERVLRTPSGSPAPSRSPIPTGCSPTATSSRSSRSAVKTYRPPRGGARQYPRNCVLVWQEAGR